MGWLRIFWIVGMVPIPTVVPSVIIFPSGKDAISVPKQDIRRYIRRCLNQLPHAAIPLVYEHDNSLATSWTGQPFILLI